MNPAHTVTTIETQLTSFAQLFGQQIGQHTVQEIEIPIIQRDYAQGRSKPSIERIRSQLVDAVCTALLPTSKSIELDFVYGDVDRNGKFMPLDGQQRLTLLFLLHCYLAWRKPIEADQQPWAKFSYATRPGAREFCKFLTQCKPDFTLINNTPSCWLIDQAEYLPTWHHDPTIQSMLVVLDNLHEWFTQHSVDFEAAWEKLTQTENPAIRFHLLPMSAEGMTNAQYIKMNSRGKPLTPFENFKAQFEEMLKLSHTDKADDFAKKIDTDWSDILWQYRGDDNLVDDEFMRCFRFATEVCAWNSGVDTSNSKRYDELAYLSNLTAKVYGSDQQNSKENLAFLFHVFDIWHGKIIKEEFENILTTDCQQTTNRLLAFHSFSYEGVDLFHACCRHYGKSEWRLADTLLFYGVLLRWSFPKQNAEVADFSNRLRSLRNLIEASSGGEIREEFMPRLLADVQQIITSGNIRQVSAFNQEQRQNELDKLKLLETDPSLEANLHQLEDHDLLRGGLTAFDLLNPSEFRSRAQNFLEIFNKSIYDSNTQWMDITGALLAYGDYSKKQDRWTGYRFADLGAPKNNDPWRTLFRGKGRGAATHPICQSLMTLLDALSASSTLQDIINDYLNTSTTAKDWRYYLVKYPVMRQGASGRYVFSSSGYEACMLDKTQMNSNYADPYLRAAVESSGIDREAIANPNWPNSFYGYENQPRWLKLEKSKIELRSVDSGWEVSNIPSDPRIIGLVPEISEMDATSNTALVHIPKNGTIDAVDRIELAANLLKRLVDLGF